MDSTFFIFVLKFHKAYNLPTVNCCPLCYVASTWLVPPPRGPALHRVGPAIKPCTRPPPASPRSTTAKLLLLKNLFPRSAPLQSCGGREWARHKLSSRAARCQMPRSQRCKTPMPAPRSAQPQVSPTPFLPDQKKPTCQRPSSSATVNWTNEEGTNTAGFWSVGRDGVV